MLFSKQTLIQPYRQRAKHYNLSANLYYLIGFREQAYRKMAVKTLNLQSGHSVIEIDCGTGLNFPLLQRQIGPTGRIIGIDLTDAMLEQAYQRVRKKGWLNVELVQTDAEAYQFPPLVNGIFSTFAITLIPEYALIIKHGAEALAPGSHFGILNLKKPENLPTWLFHLGVFATKPFGVSPELAERRPWESINKHLINPTFKQLYWGICFFSPRRSSNKHFEARWFSYFSKAQQRLNDKGKDAFKHEYG